MNTSPIIRYYKTGRCNNKSRGCKETKTSVYQLAMSSSCCAIATNVFQTGKYTTLIQKLESSSSSSSPPKQLLIGMPCEAGEFPVVILLHGFLLYNSFYSQLIQHLASHGFIVIAPQLYTVAGADTTDELKATAAITNWLSEGLCGILPPHLRPKLSKLGLAGHSRGGKAAFALALQKSGITTKLKFSAIIGIDPVDGMDKGKQTPPPVLSYVPHSFDLDMAAMVIGSGLGEVKRNPLFPPCAPKGVNHEDFFKECRKPAYHFVVKDYGHLDMLDDVTSGIRGKTSYCLCKNGKSREPMRRFVGGAMVAFFKAYLEGDSRDLMAIRKGQSGPVELQDAEIYI
ncbi:chlorophyllase-2 [Mercurialis annua]|uniref:chlorophyllase-2 n=1 Tax=Mercurialis annua TaxID=3986 RepID=UPI00215EC17F|nr:chlorophyllase-2 [Mercurialis annua]